MGILSDRRLQDNCLEYEAFPVGFANADFEGNVGNPFLNGIKTPKYQRSAPKPVSADVMAVNSAKFMPGNSFSNARNVLQQYQKEVRKWNPPPVKLMSAAEEWNRMYDNLPEQDRVFENQTRDEVKTEMNDRFYNTVQPRLAIANRGTQIIRETIGTQTENPVLLNYLNVYRQSPNKPDISSRLLSALQQRNVTLESETMEEMLRAAFSIGANVNLENIFAPEVTTAATSSATSPGGVHRGTRGIKERRPSFMKKIQTPPKPGIPEPATPSLTAEIERT